MHGEFKVPNGKLVIADLEVVEDKLSNVHISGDFFLDPESALELINQTLTGLAVQTTTYEITRVLTEALSDVQLYGFDAQAIAIAVSRALGKASSWFDHEFSIIPPVCLPAAEHVAMDEVIVEAVTKGERGPTLRFWDWSDRVVVMGVYQSLKNEIDPKGAAQHDVGIVRRITGGGAMFMEPGNCITYSLVVPASLVEGQSFEQSYAFLDAWVLGALAEIGVKAHYVPINDIASEQGKIGGAAQKRFGQQVVLHHVTMSYDIDSEKMLQVLRIGREKLSDKGTKSANKRVDPMRRQTGMSREAIINAFIDHFKRRYHTQDSHYSEQELALAKQKAQEKFLSDAWLNKVP